MAVTWKKFAFEGDYVVALFNRHTLESGDSLTINEDEQKLNHGSFTLNGTSHLIINGSGRLCVIGA